MTTDKREMRARARATRKHLAVAGPVAAGQVAQHVASLPSAKLVAVYHPIGSEMETGPLAQALVQRGVYLCLPVVTQADAAMGFRLWQPGDPLEPDLAGVPAPLPLARVVVPELILTPLLAFDVAGGRLGQGGGHYDRTFAAQPDAIRIGVAYAGQEVGPMDLEAHDIRLNGILTEAGYRAFG